jgi:hypothetical protein
MAGSETQILVWGFWGVLIAGAGLSGIGLWRSVVRFRQWKRASSGLEGEIMLGDQALRAGQPVAFYPDDPEQSRSEALCGQIREIQRKTLILTLDAMPAEPRRAAFADTLRPGSPLGVTAVVIVTGETALYRFSARVVDVRADSTRPGSLRLTLSRPLWLARIQRRQHVRVAMPIPATFERVGESFPETGPLVPAKSASAAPSLPLHAAILDLSGGGLRAEVGRAMGAREAALLVEAFVPGTLVSVRLPLPALSDAVLLARVRTCERTAVRGGLGVRLACQFLPMPHWEQEMLIHHIFRAQNEQLKTRFRPPAISPPSGALSS